MDLSKFKNLKSPYILILVGPPLSGKGWFCNLFKKNIDSDVLIVSRDEIVMDIWGNRNYNDAFSNVNHRDVDRVLHQKLLDANDSHKNVIIDMTHMTSKRRRTNLDYFTDDYFKLGIIFPILSDEEYETRNSKRMLEENKSIPMGIIKSMISQYQTIKEDEGFDKIYSL
jgi:predicted kinase